jgi:4-alpha-glucanotransferase
MLAWLEQAGQTVWQMLPLVPVDGGGCPYASPSAFARSTLLLSLDDLVTDGWLGREETPARLDGARVDFAAAAAARAPALRKAAERVRAAVDLRTFAAGHPWAPAWALYASLADVHGPRWSAWPVGLRDREPDALQAAADRPAADIERQLALQGLFVEQWRRLREDATSRGISLWGDVPFFVAAESCDTWTHRHLFRLDEVGRPTVVSGVPPDAFSDTGQLWGHPLYAEAAQVDDRYRWWLDRIDAVLELVDVVRLDHFRGLAAYWEVAADARDARDGRWIPGPGQALLDALRARIGRLPFVAEDLGVITPDVERLRDANDLPGMAVLQFAFGDASSGDNGYLPHHHRPRQAVYPGTHDNDTASGWYRTAGWATQDHVRRYLSTDARDIAGDLIRCAYRSVAETAIVPMQDVLGLGSEARLNIPGQAEGNWAWRMTPADLRGDLAGRLRDDAILTGRLGVGAGSLRPPAETVCSPPERDR